MTFWDGVKWFFEKLPLALMAIGAASVIVRACDELTQKMVVKHPKSRFWRYVGRSVVFGGTLLSWIMEVLEKISLGRSKEVPSAVTATVVENERTQL